MRVRSAFCAVAVLACASHMPSAMAQATTTVPAIKKLGKASILGHVSAPLDEACVEPFQHRRAVANDWVCVSADTANTTRDDNSSAASRRLPGGGSTCLNGFVWRGVVSNDLVCVVPRTRDQVGVDNQANASRKKKPVCEQYARQAMAGVIEAAKSACNPGSNPAYWSQNQAEHYDFCMKSPQAIAAQAGQARDAGLKDCKLAAAAKTKKEQDERDETQRREAARIKQEKERQAALAAKQKADEERRQKEAAEQARKEKCENGTILEQIKCKFGGSEAASAPAAPAVAAKPSGKP